MLKTTGMAMPGHGSSASVHVRSTPQWDEYMMDPKDRVDPEYELGYSGAELRRLTIQHDLYVPYTRRLLLDAGLSPGMKVLDVGSGAGDVSMLAADLVGDGGEVVGVEINPKSVETARSRASNAGYRNVRFELGDVREESFDSEFEAVIGRWVLMWVADPVAVLIIAKGLLKADGIIAFQESEFTFGPASFPETPLIGQIAQWHELMMEQGGPEFHMGYKLYKTFLDAGLPAPHLEFNTPIGGGPSWGGYEFIAETMRALLPRIQQLGVAGSTEVEIETLADRIRDEIILANGFATMMPVIGAWARKV